MKTRTEGPSVIKILISGIIILIIAFLINVKNVNSIQNLSIIALIFSITSFIGGGFLAGAIPVLIGSVFGIGYSYVISSRCLM